MRPYIFVDTGAFVGAWVEADQHHPAAVEVFEALRTAKRPLLTSTDVLDESVTLIKKWGSHDDALAFGDALADNRLARLVEINASRRAAAWTLFRAFDDRSFSMTDCTSIAVMKEYGVHEVFTFDAEFKKVGLIVVP